MYISLLTIIARFYCAYCHTDLALSRAKITNYDGLKRELITFNSFFCFYRSFATTFLIRFMASLMFSSLVA